MSKDLYVKNIPLEATEEDLRKHFSVAGRVTYIHLITDARTGKFVGAGYVKMATEAEAREARNCLDGALLINRVITVTEAKAQKPGEGPKGGGTGEPGRGKGPGGKRR